MEAKAYMEEAKGLVDSKVEKATIEKTNHRIAMQVMVTDPTKYKEAKNYDELTQNFWSRFPDAAKASKKYGAALEQYEKYSLLHCVHEDVASMSLFEAPDAMTTDQFYDFLEKGAQKKKDDAAA